MLLRHHHSLCISLALRQVKASLLLAPSWHRCLHTRVMGTGWNVSMRARDVAEMAQNCQPGHNEILGQMTNLPQYQGASLPLRRNTEFLAAE